MSTFPGKPSEDKDIPLPGKFKIVCPRCLGKRFFYDRWVSGLGPLQCEQCGGEGVIDAEKGMERR